jgi:hypothetical protein
VSHGYPLSTLWVADAAGGRRRAIARRVESPSWAPDASGSPSSGGAGCPLSTPTATVVVS